MSGTSRNPVVLPSSSSASASPDVDPSPSGRASTSASNNRRSPVRPWTVEQETMLVDLLHDSLRYQDAFLPGHHNSIPAPTIKTSGATMLRAISASIFPPGQTKNADQIRSKITHLVKRYRAELTAMTQTGQGLLLDEMRPGPIKNAREELLQNCPWWETMHIMIRDRSSSDPDMIVTGAGEINPGSNLTPVSDSSSPLEASNDGDQQSQGSDNQDTDSMIGLGIQSPYSRRASKRKFDDNDDDEQQEDDMDEAEDGDTQQSSTSTSSSRFSPQKLFIPTPGHLLPALSSLADRINDDPMSRTSAQSSASSSRPGASPGPSSTAKAGSDKGNGKTSSNQKSSDDVKGKGKARAVESPTKEQAVKSEAPSKPITKTRTEQAVDDLGRQFSEERQLRAQAAVQASIEREHTRRYKLELKSRNREAQTGYMEHRLDALASKLDAIQVQAMRNAQSISELTSSINTFTAKIDIMSMVLQHLPSASHTHSKP